VAKYHRYGCLVGVWWIQMKGKMNISYGLVLYSMLKPYLNKNVVIKRAKRKGESGGFIRSYSLNLSQRTFAVLVGRVQAGWQHLVGSRGSPVP